MSKSKMKISLSSLPHGYIKLSEKAIAESNSRIKTAMKKTTRDFQKKQRISLERATKIVLNA